MFYLTTHSTHFNTVIWCWTVREETRFRHMGYSFRLAAFLLYAPSHIQDSTYYGLCYTSRGALAGTKISEEDQGLLQFVKFQNVVNTGFIHFSR